MMVCKYSPETRLLPEIGPIYRKAIVYVRLTPLGEDALFRVTLECTHVVQSKTRLARLICRECKRGLIEVVEESKP